MFIKNWKDEIFTIPNLLSLIRLFMIPIYASIYLKAESLSDYLIAGILLATSCLTDALDGFVARKFQMTSALGKFLDPLADKITQFTLVLCLSIQYRVLLPVVILLIVKEILQAVGAVLLLHRNIPLPCALSPGKISTFVLFVSLICLVIFPGMDIRIVNTIAVLDSLCLILAFLTYCHVFLEKLTDPPPKMP